MKGKVSPLLRRINADPEAHKNLMNILSLEADSNVLGFEGKKYVIDDYSESISCFYKRKIQSKP